MTTRTAEEIASEAIAKLNKRITNEVFLIIQKDRDLMHDYLRAVETQGLDTVNQTIGKRVKASYNLTNDGTENDPSCTLITTHTTFK
ncbi:MAG: hypothetical protein FWG50_10070 [Kiritimatiellaeota bacterium]|nr:hypothetical protein [Kiritimatiellota bacterium]